jgi:molybdopterin-synthase adenylyltransferase
VTLSDAELERYSRQLVLPEWSGAAQERLRAASVVLVGAGALGSPVGQYLAAAGVGRIGVVDDDLVELSNLNRQPLHFTPDITLPKADNAKVKLAALNPEILVEAYPARLDEQNAEAILLGADAVVDCSDSFDTRYAVNDACCAAGIPLVEAGVLGFSGLVLSIVPGRSACYRCAFPVEPPPGSVPSCREAGVLGAMAGIIGSIQALEAIKLLTGVGEPLLDKILQVEGLDLTFTTVHTGRQAGCPACARVPAAQQSAG